jgi:hypothetical protein
MKRFVGGIWGEGAMITAATVTVAAATGANGGATYLIAVGFLAIATIRRRLKEPPEDIGPSAIERTGAGRSTGSR